MIIDSCLPCGPREDPRLSLRLWECQIARRHGIGPRRCL